MALRPWAKRMQTEVDQLPDTLAALREASVHIKQVSQDLTSVADSLKRVTEALEAAGLSEATEVLTTSANAMRTSVKKYEEFNEAILGNLAKFPGADLLNPFRKPR